MTKHDPLPQRDPIDRSIHYGRPRGPWFGMCALAIGAAICLAGLLFAFVGVVVSMRWVWQVMGGT